MYISDFFVIVQNANGKMYNKIYFVYFRILHFILINIKFEFPDSGLMLKCCQEHDAIME